MKEKNLKETYLTLIRLDLSIEELSKWFEKERKSFTQNEVNAVMVTYNILERYRKKLQKTLDKWQDSEDQEVEASKEAPTEEEKVTEKQGLEDTPYQEEELGFKN